MNMKKIAILVVFVVFVACVLVGCAGGETQLDPLGYYNKIGSEPTGEMLEGFKQEETAGGGDEIYSMKTELFDEVATLRLSVSPKTNKIYIVKYEIEDSTTTAPDETIAVIKKIYSTMVSEYGQCTAGTEATDAIDVEFDDVDFQSDFKKKDFKLYLFSFRDGKKSDYLSVQIESEKVIICVNRMVYEAGGINIKSGS